MDLQICTALVGGSSDVHLYLSHLLLALVHDHSGLVQSNQICFIKNKLSKDYFCVEEHLTT